MKKRVLLLISLFVLAIIKLQAQPNAWINELHYDNVSTDVGEFVEIVIENAGSYVLSDFQLDLYNGNDGASYDTKTLDAFLQGSTSGNFTFFTYTYPTNGIQNGAPDGLALSYQGIVITGQFLSYEGTFTAIGGPADGLTSTDIGVSESSGTPVGHSLQLSGSGTLYSNFTWQAPAAETPGNLNNSQSFGGIVYPQIIKAWSKSATEIDVEYNLEVTSIDPEDYYMTGSGYIEFGSATIDGSNPKLVHLTSPSAPIANDITLDQLFDAANSTDYEFYAGILSIANTNASPGNPSGLMLDGYTATFQGIVSANDAFNNVWISDNSGQYNGVMIFSNSFDELVAVGDEILFTAEREVYLDLTELVNPALINILSTGNSPYGPDIIPGSDIEENISVNTDPAEAWEGQLVKIENFTVESYVDYDYTCSWSDGKATYFFHVGDNVNFQFGSILLSVGVTYESITGVVDWNNNLGSYRINPRSQSDIPGGNPPVKLAITSVNNGFNPYTSTDFEVIVQAQDNLGNPALVGSDVNFTFTTDGGDVGNVVFVSGTATSGTILSGTSELTVTGVQMAPAGTNVTITANDDNLFGGLASGTSIPFDVVDFLFPEIMITEIMQNPKVVTDANGEWFEIFNFGNVAIDLTNWVIKDAGTNSHTISGPLTILPGEFAVLGNNGDPGTNGGYTCDYVYPGSFALGNGDDEVILCLPGGDVVVDEVYYDGGTLWPDPDGSSMVFAGFTSDDNNDGSNWVTAYRREGTYTGEGDYGSPGTAGYQQLVAGGFKLDLKVFLEGPYDAGLSAMSGNLFIPSNQSYDPTIPYYGNGQPIWNYLGPERYFNFSGNEIDWILVELRDAPGPAGAGSIATIDQRPAMLLDDGRVVCINGVANLSFNLSLVDDLFIVIWHRNHLGIMSATGFSPVDGTVVSYDFTTGPDKVYNATATDYKELETGVWGMAAGDVNADGTINDLDLIDGWSTEAGTTGYLGGDLNFDRQSNNQDKNDLWVPNEGAGTKVPE